MMDKKDLTPLIIAGLLLVTWMMIGQKIFPPRDVPIAPPPAETAEPEHLDPSRPAVQPVITESDRVPADPDTEVEPVEEQPPAEYFSLRNDLLNAVISTHGAALLEATFHGKDRDGEFLYPQTLERDSDPVFVDFSGMPALAYEGVPGLGDDFAYRITGQPTAHSVVLERRNAQGLELRRTLELGDDYTLHITDQWTNDSDMPRSIEGARIRLGPMSQLEGMQIIRGQSYMGVDTLVTGADRVQNWGRRFEKIMRNAARPGAAPPMMWEYDPMEGMPREVVWAAAKNKYFVKILHLEDVGEQVLIRIYRAPTQAEDPGSEHRAGAIVIDQAAAVIALRPDVIESGATLERSYTCYLGPKKFSALRELGDHKEQVMEFGARGVFSFLDGVMKFIQSSLLLLLNGIYGVVGNYGVAIILLTILVKIIFWPITHKGMSSMRRMQELQPQMTAIKTKYKDDAKRQQEEIMKLYKEHKINPVGGCLPMIIQIPVFIALFTVLRSAIELRFAGFLWIPDLSEAERLVEFGFTLPLVGWDALNVLPILMTVTMVLQQRMAPATGDAQQRRMMAVLMPLMMFYFFYSMPSGLILYWTTNQVATIIGQLFMRYWRARKKTESKGGGGKAK